MSTGASARVMELLLAETTGEDRERLRVAWERHAQGDPDSLPAIYALADRFSLNAHAALLDRQEQLLESFQDRMANPQLSTAARIPKTSRVWATGTLCCLVAGATGAAVDRQLSTSASGNSSGMLEQIRAAGGDLTHRLSRRGDKTFHVLELRSATSLPEAYLTPEHHGVIVFEHQPVSDSPR